MDSHSGLHRIFLFVLLFKTLRGPCCSAICSNDPHLFLTSFVTFWTPQWGPSDPSSPYKVCSCPFYFFFLFPLFNEGILVVSSTKGVKKKKDQVSCWGTTRSKQICLFTCEVTRGDDGNKTVSKSGFPDQRKQVQILSRIVDGSTTHMPSGLAVFPLASPSDPQKGN